MKHFIVIFLIISGIIWYQIDKHQKFTDNYNSSKSQLLSEIKELNTKKREISLISQSHAEEPKKIEKKIEIKEVPLKSNLNLNVDFFPQSPFGKWGPIFNDTCEEASALIAINYVRNNKMTRTEFRDELLSIVDYENKTFGDYIHTNVDQTAQILEDYFKFLNYSIIDNPTINDIKRSLNEGNIIIAPFYGIGLNPHFTGKGPEYHFIVIKGYTQDEFITHEVGSKHGENYHYSQADLMERLHDYDSVSVKNGAKKLIVIKK